MSFVLVTEHWTSSIPSKGGLSSWELAQLDSSRAALCHLFYSIFKEIISRHSQGLETIQFENLKISADDVLLASKSQDLQHVLGQRAAQCEAARMTINTSKSEVIVLYQKRVPCPRWVV